MDRPRTSADIQTVGDFLTLVKGGEKAQFLCEGGGDGILPKGSCKKNLSTFGVTKLPNNGEDYFVKCPRCGRTIYFNAGWIAAAVLQAQAMRAEGKAPAVGTFPELKGAGSMVEERPLPNGRKLIIARPRAANGGARVSHGT